MTGNSVTTNGNAASGAPSPGDEAEPGAPQTAENSCRDCGGTGRLDGENCPTCEGTGLVTVTVGDA
ncbi:hypothetical protein [Roseomonas sp. BN140053]|uniref:hypothetical protein n=1 Tax=Roseomonas sp. BN140053 TaxID=3391898 RepID=UPI0039E82055